MQPGPLTFPSARASSSCHRHRTWRRTMGTRVYLYFPSRGQESPGKHVGPEPWVGGGGSPIWASRGGAVGAQRELDPGEADISELGKQIARCIGVQGGLGS